MRKTFWSTVCKVIGLAALDMASACLLFDWWRIQSWPNRIPLYAIILISLLMLHVLALFPIQWKQSMHMRSSLLSLWIAAFCALCAAGGGHRSDGDSQTAVGIWCWRW